MGDGFWKSVSAFSAILGSLCVFRYEPGRSRVKCAVSQDTVFTNIKLIFRAKNLAGELLLFEYVEADVWSASLRDVGVTVAEPPSCLTEVRPRIFFRALLGAVASQSGEAQVLSDWVRADSRTRECAVVHASALPSRVPPHSPRDRTPRST